MVGIVKGDIGIRDGRIVGIGKAGNPQPAVRRRPAAASSGRAPTSSPASTSSPPPGRSTPTSTSSARSRRSKGCPTASPRCSAAASARPTAPTRRRARPAPWNIHRMLEAIEDLPVNVGLLGKGNGSLPEALVEQIEAGAAGLKVHEDWGSTPAALSGALDVADATTCRWPCTPTPSTRPGFVEDTIAAIAGRAIHTYHTEGAGGGHAPDIIKMAGQPQRAAVVDQPDAAVHRQLGRRAARHGDGLPPPVPRHPRGRRLRRLAGCAPRRSRPRRCCTTSA